MGKVYYLFIAIFFMSAVLTAQSVTGKLVNISGAGLSGLQVKVYTSPSYNTVNTSSDGTFTVANVTGIENDQLPSGYNISNNFPNPFNPKTRINISVPYKSNVKVDVFNLLGQNVGRGVNKVFEAGDNYVILELNGLPNGVYIARIDIDGKYTLTKKMMLVYGSRHLASAVNYSSNILENNAQTKKLSSIVIDSIVVTGTTIKRNSFTGLPQITGSSLNLGNLIVNTTNTGVPCAGIPTITYAGKIYNTVKIGSQCWFKENLNVGTMIQGNVNQSNNSVIEKYCYNNDINNCTLYGGLYQWNEAMQYSSNTRAQGICPTGWHIPDLSEFTALKTFVNSDSRALETVGQLYAYGTETNTSGFSALYGGIRDTNKTFTGLGVGIYFQSSSSVFGYSGYMGLLQLFSVIYLPTDSEYFGESVRCIKD